MTDETTLFDFELPDFDAFIKGVGDSTKTLEKMRKEIEKFSTVGTVLPSDFVNARDAQQIVKNLQDEIAGIIKLKKVIDEQRKSASEALKDKEDQKGVLDALNESYDDLGASIIKRVVEMNNFARTITNTSGPAAKLKKAIQGLYKDIDVSAVIKYSQKDALNAEGIIDRLRDIREESRVTIDNISMIGDALLTTTNSQARQELQKNMQSFIGGMLLNFEEERGLSRFGASNTIDASLLSMKTLEQQIGYVSKAMKEASSPEEFAILKDIFDDLSGSLTRQREELEKYTGGLSAAQLEAMEFGKAGRSFADSMSLAQNQIRETYREILKTQTLLKSSSTVEQQTLYQSKLIEQNKLLKEQQEKLKSLQQLRSVRGQVVPLDQEGKPVQGMSDLAGKLQQVVGVTNSLAQAFGLSADKAKGFTRVVVEINEALNTASKAAQLGQSIKDALTEAANGMQVFALRIKAQNDLILMNDQSLSRSNIALGKFGNFIGGAGSLLSKFAGGIGLITAGFEVGKSVIGVYNTIMGKSEEQIKRNIDVVKKQIEVNKKINDLISEGNVQQLESERRRVQKQIDEVKATIRELTESYWSGNADFGQQFASVFDYLFQGQVNMYGPIADEIRELQKTLSDLDMEANALSDGGLLAQIERTKELNDVASKADQIQSELVSREKELFDLRIDMLEKQGNLAEELAKIELNENDVASNLANAREAQFKKDFKSLWETLGDMEDDYGQEILNLRDAHYANLFKMESDYNKSVADAWEDLRKSLADMDKDFAKSEAEALEQYNEQQVEEEKSHRKTIRQIEKDFEKERIERMKRAQEAMFQAELANDALAFFNAQRQAKQEEKEAQKRREEQIVEQEKSYKKSKRKTAEQFAEDRAEALEQHNERKAEAHAQHLENLANMKEQYDEQVALAKEQHDKDLIDAAKRYEELRAKELEAFKKRQEDLKVQYEEEDALRADQNQKRRQELLATYELELKYFADREAILQQYIGAIQQTKTGKTQATGLIQDQYLSREEFTALRDTVLSPVLQRLQNIPNRSDAETEMYNRLYGIFEAFSYDSTQGVVVTDELYSAVYDAISESYDRGLVEYKDAFQLRLDYGGTEREAYAEQASGLEAGASLVPEVISGLTDAISNLVAGIFGPATQRELDAQGRRTQNELAQTGTETYDAVRQNFDDIYDYEVGQYQSRLDTERQALDDRVRYGEYYWDETNQTFSDQYGNQIDMQETFGDDALYVQQMMNQDMLSTTSAGNDALLGEQEGFQSQETSMRNTHGRQLLTQEELLARQRQMMIIGRSMMEAQAIVNVYSLINRNIVAGATYALGQLTAALLKMSLVSLLGGGKPFNPFSNFFGGGGTGSPITLAAEGGYFNKPTPTILSEGRTPGEIAIPFSESRGIPDNIATRFGESIFNAAQKFSSNQDLPYSVPFQKSSSSQIYGDTVSVHIGDITVGNGVSRAEVGQQIENLGMMIADRILLSKMPTGNRR